MESLYKSILTFTFLTLFQLLTAATSASAKSTASGNCSEKCGNMNISYPFGIKDGCFRNGFQIHCNEASGTATTVDNIEIVDISISQAQMRIYNWIGYSCNYPKGDNLSYISYLGISDRRYRLSHTHNKFTAVGCQTLATILDPQTKSNLFTNNSDIFATGCISLCTNQSRFVNYSTCSGVGCCQTAIPQGLSHYKITFNPGFINEAIWDYSPCSFAFLAEDGFYSFLQSDTQRGNLLRRFEQAPVVLDWVVENEPCKDAKLNKSGKYACVSSHSSCKDSNLGYTCVCNQGYEGNPYIHGGCTNY